MSAHVKREQSLQSNSPEAFACVMNCCCTDGLKTQLIAIPTCESMIRDDPLAILTAIKTCVHDEAHTQHPPVSISTHWDRLVKLKQAKDEDPSSHAKGFEQQLKTVKGCIGSAFTNGFAEHVPECKAHACKQDTGKIAALLAMHVAYEAARIALADDLVDLFSHCKPKETQHQLDFNAQARSEFKACLLLRSVSKAKHGSLLTAVPCRPSIPSARNSTQTPSTRLWTSSASTVRIRTLPTSANQTEILAIPTQTTVPWATTTRTTAAVIRIHLV